MKKTIFFMACISLFMGILMANVPAPYWACSELKEGDKCKYGYGCGANGKCVLVKNCRDKPDTKINECLQCRT